MLRGDNNGKNVVLYRTHLRNISDQDFIILEEVYQELGTLYNRKKRRYRLDKNTDITQTLSFGLQRSYNLVGELAS